MKQRAQLARALGLQTEILLMDEPFAALDEQTRMVLGEDLSVLLARTGKTIVFVTHSLVEAVFLADRVAVFTARPGRIKTIISVDEPHPRSRSFMTSEKLGRLRNELYELLHDEIRKTMGLRQPENRFARAIRLHGVAMEEKRESLPACCSGSCSWLRLALGLRVANRHRARPRQPAAAAAALLRFIASFLSLADDRAVLAGLGGHPLRIDRRVL